MPYIGNITQDFNVNNAMLDTDSVTSIKIVDGTIEGADIAANLDLSDTQKIRLGAGNDLQINHDGTNNLIVGSAPLFLRSNNLLVQNGAGTEGYMQAVENGAVSLYYDNSKKFETTSTGVTISSDNSTGSILSGVIRFTPSNSNTVKVMWDESGFSGAGHFQAKDNVAFTAGDSSDLKIYHNGTHNFIDSSNGAIYLRGSGNNAIRVEPVAGEDSIIARSNGAVELYYDNSKKLETTSAGVSFNDGNITNVGIIALDAIKGDADDNTNITFAGSDVITFKCGDTSPALTVNTTQVKVEDSQKFVAGTGNDLQIYHDGSNSYIQDTDQGNLFIEASAVLIRKNGTTENIAKFIQDGAVELYYDNSKKFETTSTGILIDGSDTTGSEVRGDFRFKSAGSGTTKILWDSSGNEIRWNDNYFASFGTASDLKIYHDSNNSVIDSNTGNLYIQSANSFFLQGSSNDNVLKYNANGAVELYYDNSKQFETTADGVNVQGHITLAASNNAPKITFDENGADDPKAEIQMDQVDGSNGNLIFKTEGSGTLTEHMRIDSVGGLRINTTGVNADNELLSITEAGTTHNIGGFRINNASNDKILINMIHVANSGDRKFFSFKRTGSITEIGSINTTASATAFNTSSDYRLKENQVLISDGITRLKTLKPYRFNFKIEPDKTVDGFFAHEVSSAVPEAITGVKDAVETSYYTSGDTIPDGKAVGDVKEENVILPQSLDYSKFTPLLTAALQEAIAKIEVLETKVASLEAA